MTAQFLALTVIELVCISFAYAFVGRLKPAHWRAVIAVILVNLVLLVGLAVRM